MSDTDLTDLVAVDLTEDLTEDIIGGSGVVGGDDQPPSQPAAKDEVVSKLIPNKISECANYLGPAEVCMSGETLGIVAKTVGTHSTQPAAILDEAKEKLHCDDEKCVLEKLTPQLGSARVHGELKSKFKIKGPTSSKLLSNIHIDAILQQWRQAFPDFYPYNFNMLNYASYSFKDGYILNQPDSLATILFSELYSGEIDGTKYKCAACVINSDTYQGDGKHWMALFADARSTPWTVEFFNSSGHAPAPEWVNWMEKTKNNMQTVGGVDPVMVKVSSIRHQKSRSECGLYSLFYVWARLNGIPYDYFSSHHIPDQLMFEFRYQLFEDSSRPKIKEFNWNNYIRTTKTQWEK